MRIINKEWLAARSWAQTSVTGRRKVLQPADDKEGGFRAQEVCRHSASFRAIQRHAHAKICASLPCICFAYWVRIRCVVGIGFRVYGFRVPGEMEGVVVTGTRGCCKGSQTQPARISKDFENPNPRF